ncbi:MAG: bile acid:sodium symporter [Verrucomicrobia bacterium]|nr:bile acid:sodium symporter [Verrucomicrobiota bacterium]
MPYRILRDQWFLVGLLVVAVFALLNPTGLAAFAAGVLKRNHGTQLGIAAIFLLSGLDLEWDHIREAICDWKATLLSLGAIFALAPLLAWLLAHATSSQGIRLGLLLISVVPTTLASGVVMCSTAGGRVAHALLITILANCLSIVIVPTELALLTASEGLNIVLPRSKMSWDIFILVLVPLLAGMGLRKGLARHITALPFRLNVLSRGIILIMFFIGASEGRASILGGGSQVAAALFLVVMLHLSLAAVLWAIIRVLRWEAGRRESVFLMGIQKTLPMSIWLQTTFFPAHGLALAVCVFYHITQLLIDSWFAARLAQTRPVSR